MEGLICVHLGAGRHNDKLKRKYQKLINGACIRATTLMRNGGTATEACAEATAFLEDSPLTNAGYGSNLSWGGSVECDASVMGGDTLHYGAVGGVSGVKNPVLLAKLLCEKQRHSLPCGRIPPSFLVGEGARIYAVQNGLTTVASAELISADSWKQYQHYRKKLRRHAEEHAQSSNNRLDTVGAVCIDTFGHVAASCSSGGIALKTCGRIGQAAVYAGGVWAQDATADAPAVAACTSGCGEHLVRTMLAREGALSVLQDKTTEISLHDCMKTKFLESPFLNDLDEKMGGIIVLKYNPSEDIGELLWSHSTTSMCVGFMSTTDKKAKFRLSRLATGQQTGKSLTLEGTVFHSKSRSRKHTPSPSVSDSETNDNDDESNFLEQSENIIVKEELVGLKISSEPSLPEVPEAKSRSRKRAASSSVSDLETNDDDESNSHEQSENIIVKEELVGLKIPLEPSVPENISALDLSKKTSE